MSRCFPFPPPGYEKKARTEDQDLLKKEKQREKKHKKEKKDKEKRESKDKKDKDRSEEKHKEKKDKKEKHRDKKKEKERDKDKDKSSNSDEKRLSGKSEGHDGEKTSNEEKIPGKSEGHNGEKFSQKEKESDKDRSSYSSDKRVAGKLSGYSTEKLGQNSYLAGDTKESKFLQGLGRRVGDDDRASGNQLVEKFVGMERKRDENMLTSVAKATGGLDEGKEKKKRGDDRTLDETKCLGNVMVQNVAGMVHTRVEGTPRSLGKDVGSRTEGKEKIKQKEGDDKRGDKRKHKDREKNDQGKDKEKKKDKEKMKSEHKNIEKDKLKNSNKDDLIGSHNMKTLHVLKDTDKNAICEGNPRKRKEFETNGFYHANDMKPNKLSRPTSSLHALMETNKVPRPTSSSHPVSETNKLPRPTSSSHSLLGNGRILEPCQTSTLSSSDSQGAAVNLKADSKECKVNGMIVSQPLSVSTAKPLFTTAQADQITEASVKPPHPDTKYLSQVLSLPKVEEWSDFDDQEWLFNSSDSQMKKPEVASLMNDKMPDVWAEAIRIESADVCALPYVIPY